MVNLAQGFEILSTMPRVALLKFVMDGNLQACKKELLDNPKASIRARGVTFIGELSMRVFLAIEGVGVKIFAHDSMSEEKRLKQDIQDKIQVRVYSLILFMHEAV